MKVSIIILAAVVGCAQFGCSSGGKGANARQPGAGAGAGAGDPDAQSGSDPTQASQAPPQIGTPFGDGTVDARLVNEPGKVVTLDKILVPGKITIVDFYASWCGACKVMEKKLLDEISGVAGIVVRKIDLVDDVSEASIHYQVGRALPEMWIFNRRGERVHQLLGGKTADAGRLAKELLGSQ